ncbi:hypothetical protein F4808DRAFT_454040 [Astrocystis sublimbata]|nr:hypothetical protein F4808DRAFT_454040 [Astrocystis sublimbata]
MRDFAKTSLQLASQWSNPKDVTTILMIIGGDIVQKALAQTTGCLYTPVCFSFGWVAYAFIALIGVIGDGRLLPPPDCAVKVFNLKSGYYRDNKHWIIGRIVRDMESYMSRTEPMPRSGLRISVWRAEQNLNHHTNHSYSKIHILGVVVTVLQFTIAAIPLIVYGNWGVLLLTVAGTFLALVMGALPQWRAEKLPNRQHSSANFALTFGNGSKDIMVILGGKNKCLDLEELAFQETPRNLRPWEKFRRAKPDYFEKPQTSLKDSVYQHRNRVQKIYDRILWGLPIGFWVTIGVCVAQSLAWLLLLLTSAGFTENAWYIILVGVIGMFQNAYLAAAERSPDSRNLPLTHVETIIRQKVMDGLMDLEIGYDGCGRPLLREFFPGVLLQDEEAWWNGERKDYDHKRSREKQSRGAPRISTTSVANTQNRR